MARRPKQPASTNEAEKLIRETAGRYRTADGRFTVESEAAGGWYVSDSERTDELGGPRLLGPFTTLAAARDAIAAARAAPAEVAEPVPLPRPQGRADGKARKPHSSAASATRSPPRPSRPRAVRPAPAPPSTPPTWLDRLDPPKRARARRMISALERVGVPEPERLARADVEGLVPQVAPTLLVHRLWREAIDGWAEHGLEASAAGRAAAEVAVTLGRLREAGASESDLRELARYVALRTAGIVVAVVAAAGRGPDADALPGWRLLEVNGPEGEQPRPIFLSADDLLRLRPATGEGARERRPG